jgi:tetratricopeptide (TPR) repeat protein
MLVYFFTDWCGYCRSFEREVLSDREVEASLGGRVIRVRLNPEVGAEEDSVAMRYGVKGYPSLFLVVLGAEPVRASTTVNGEEVGPPSEFLARLDAKIASAAKRRLAAGRERFQAGDTAGAVEALGDAIGLAPADAALYYERGTIHHRSGDPVRAFDDFRAALGLDPGYAAPISFLARALGEEGRWEEAVTCWNRRLEQAPSDPVAFYERSRAHYNRRDRVRARADLEQSCRLGEQQACRLLARI